MSCPILFNSTILLIPLFSSLLSILFIFPLIIQPPFTPDLLQTSTQLLLETEIKQEILKVVLLGYMQGTDAIFSISWFKKSHFHF